jgi:N-acetylglucosamine-6-sulfatase
MFALSIYPTALEGNSMPGWNPPPPHGPVCKDCPNIVFSLTDDQDIELGGWTPMEQTQAQLQDDKNGALLTSWRIHTPICSPSRSQTISGRYFHNIKSSVAVPPPKLLPAATAHVDPRHYTNDTFGVHLRAQRGYNVAIFGKSNFNTQEGFDRWFQGAFLGYGGSWEDNESPTFKYHAAPTEYATALLGNRSIEWLRRDNVTGGTSEGRPFFLYFAPHCPHTPAMPADWYNETCAGTRALRTPAYNYSAAGFHELVARQPPLTAADETLIDDLARRRCQCLLSVDDAHAALVSTVQDLGRWETTYWIITSDHGYNLGHHRIPSNKFLLYDHALRIPMVVRGPGVAGGNNSVLGTNVDYAPTFLGLAGIVTPATMDGRSLVSQLVPARLEHELPAPTRAHVQAERRGLGARPWRTEQFVQYYNQGGPSPYHPQGCDQGPGFRPCEGWAPGSSSNPKQPPGDLNHCPFPGHEKLRATVRPLDDYSNTYIGLTCPNCLGDGHHYKYGEYKYVCSTADIAAKACFAIGSIDQYQLFNMSSDPWELYNIYNQTDASVVSALAARLRMYYPCQGSTCP